MLFRGFRLFGASFPILDVRAVLPSPKAGTFDDRVLVVDDAAAAVSLFASKERLVSFSVTVIPRGFHFSTLVFVLLSLYGSGARLGPSVTSESLTPAVGGRAVVARGFRLTGGASDG